MKTTTSAIAAPGPASRLARIARLCCLLLIAGCATLPKSVPIPDDEADRVRREFKTMLQGQGVCPAALDSDVTASVGNLVWTGTISGYLRAMAPDYLRFEGVNPLGLTEALATVDGEQFAYLAVRDREFYSGPLSAELLKRYLPDGLATSLSYYLLLGGVAPGALRIEEVGRDPEGQGYWLGLHYPETDKRDRILFNSDKRFVRRHLVLNSREAIALDLSYEYKDNPAASDCQLPTVMVIRRPGNGSLTVKFTKRYPTPPLDTAQFRLTPPAEYKRIEVQ